MILILFLLASAAFGQNPNTAAFPTTVATDTDLLVAKRLSQSTLSSSINNSVTSVTVADGTQFLTQSVIKIDSEEMLVTNIATNTLTVTRAFNGTTAASHTSGATVSGVITSWHHNQVAAEIKTIEARLRDTTSGCSDAGSTDAYACNLSPAITSYSTGTVYRFKANTSNTGAATISFNSIGDKTIKKHSSSGLVDLDSNDIYAGDWVYVVYNGTYMQLLGGIGGSGGGTWGSITGTLSSQTDLQSALDAKIMTAVCAGSGTANAITCTPSPAVSSLTNGLLLVVVPSVSNTSATTINVSGLGTKDVYKYGDTGSLSALVIGDLTANYPYLMTYSSAQNAFVVINQANPLADIVLLYPTCLTTSSSATTYACTLSHGGISQYISNYFVVWNIGSTACTGGVSTTLDLQSLGAKRVYKEDGTTDPATADCTANRRVLISYDSTLTGGSGGWRILNPAISSVAVQADGSAVGTRSTINIVSGTGITPVVADTGSRIDITHAIDTAVVQTHANFQGGSDVYCAPSSASGTTYTCSLSPALTAYTTGMTISFKPDVAASGTPTLNINSLGAKTLRMPDGTTTPTSSDLPAGQLKTLWYDGTYFRIVSGSGSGSTPTSLAATDNGSASFSPIKGSGTIYTGGSATTTKPYFLIEPSGATSTGWSTNGTAIGANAASGFTGNLIDAQLNGASSFKVDANGAINGNTTANRILYTTTNGKPTTDAALTFDGTTLYSASRITSGGDVRMGGGNVIAAGLTDGNLTLYNSAASDFGRINFGGTSSSFPALKRSTTTIQARLADDSSYADIRVRAVQHSTGARPTCDSTSRGTTWYVAGGAGVADTFEICRKDASDVYAWVTLF